MSDKKGLTIGMWCKPRDEKEWRAVLDISESLGMMALAMGARDFQKFPCVWFTESGSMSQCADDSRPTNTSVPAFIASMYEEAEKRKDGTAKCGCPADGYISEPVHPAKAPASPELMKLLEDFEEMAERVMSGVEPKDRSQLVGTTQLKTTARDIRQAIDKMMNHKTNKQRFEDHEQRIKALEDDKQAWEAVINSHTKRILDGEKRLANLEKALNDHMVKEREKDFRYLYPLSRDEVFKADRTGNKVTFQDGREGVVIEDTGGTITVRVPKDQGKPLEPIAGNPALDMRECENVKRPFFVNPIEDIEAGNRGFILKIDPKASPKDIPFSVALEYLKIGREIARPHWRTPARRRVQPHGIGGVGGLYVITGASCNMGPFHPDAAEMVSTDWQVLPEDAK